VKHNEQTLVELHGRHLPALKMLNLKQDDFILDVGCASGALLQRLFRAGPNNLVGIDIEKDLIRRSPRYLSAAVGSGLSGFGKVTRALDSGRGRLL